MINKDQLRLLIRNVLKDVDLYSESAEELLILTAAVESNLGTYIRQVRGPALGIFQMEPATEMDIWNNYLVYRSHILDKGEHLGYMPSGIGQIKNVSELEYNLAYQIIMARLHYMRVPSPLPAKGDVTGLAVYWKTYFNTKLGKGTVTKALEKYEEYVRD